ncbi:MAG: YihY family inner membrane protein [SAR324 cluster bacterium]|nr:YihY family inner membrane protein [SAR324 cluster bacterium]
MGYYRKVIFPLIKQFQANSVWLSRQIKIKIIRIKDRYVIRLFRFWQLTGEICWERDIFSLAQSLSYVTVLSLVPLFMIFFFILSKITANTEYLEYIEIMISRYFLSDYAANIIEALNNLSKNALSLGLIGFPTLLVLGIFIYVKVDTSINRLWSTLDIRGVFQSFSAFINSVLIGPILVVAVLSMPSYFKILLKNQQLNLNIAPGEIEILLFSAAPFVSTFVLLTLLYYFIPTEKVRLKSALIGAFWISIAVRLANWLVEYYLKSFSQFDVLYGSLTMLPVLMFWLYAMWLMILFGSVLTYVHQTFAHQRFVLPDNLLVTQSNLGLAFKIVIYLTDCFNRRSEPLDLLGLCYSLKSEKAQTQKVIKHLMKKKIIYAINEGGFISRANIRYQLACNPDKIKISEVVDLYSSRKKNPHLSSSLNEFFYKLDTAPYHKFYKGDLESFWKLQNNQSPLVDLLNEDKSINEYTINVEKLRVNLCIGVYEWEKTTIQPVDISFKVGFDNPQLKGKDDIALAVDYVEVIDKVKQAVKGKQYNLVESLLDHVLEVLKEIEGVNMLWAKVSKAYAGEDDSKVSMEKNYP